MREIYLHLWCCLKFLQDMAVLHSFCSLWMVMALLCVTSEESLLCSQQSYIVLLFSMWISILCKRGCDQKTAALSVAFTAYLVCHLWEKKQTSLQWERKQVKNCCQGLFTEEHWMYRWGWHRMNSHSSIGISLCPAALHPARNMRKMLPVPRSTLPQSLKTDYSSHVIFSALTTQWLRVVSAVNWRSDD